MTNLVEEYWEVDGVSLSTYAWAIRSLDGREGIPPRRGANETVPYKHGALWRPKTPDQKAMSLAMWVRGWNADDTMPANLRATFRSNLESLKALFGVYDRQLVITKRLRTEAGLLVLSGQGECVNTLDPTMRGSEAAALVVDILMADPYWYGEEIIATVPVAGATISNPGSTPAIKFKLRFNGPLTNPQLVNVSLDTSWALSYIGAIAGGEWVEFDTDNYTALNNLGVSVLGSMTHSGGHEWMKLKPGSNAFVLNVDAGTGNAVFTFSPPYL